MLPGTAQPEKKYRLRWRFEYSDGTAPRYGCWNGGEHGMAAKTNTENLLFAVVEGEAVGTWEIERLAEMSGQDFIQFRWIAAAPIPGGGLAVNNKEVILPSRLLGLKMVGRNDTAEIFMNGKGRIIATSDDDKLGFVEAYRK